MNHLKKDSRMRASEAKGSIWLMTFNDMMTLLLTFFVLLLSLSKMDVAKMEEISGAVGSAFGLPGPEEKASVRVFDPFILSPEAFQAGQEQGAVPERKENEYEQFLKKRDAFIRRCSGHGRMAAKATANGVRISMGGSGVFPEGAARIAAEGQEDLLAVCSLLEGTRPYIRVEVFTGETPAQRERYPGSWELAVARGAGVAQFISSRGGVAPERISVSGYGVMKPAARKAGRSPATQGGVVDVTLTFYES